jgi:hypothetical protein
MSGIGLDLGSIGLDEAGRVVLSDEILDELNAVRMIVSAGGSNTSCTNAPCVGETNVICSNTQCEGATNKMYCIDGPF